MVYYAYEDEERTIEVLAENVNDDNKLEHYFCRINCCASPTQYDERHGNGDGQI